MEEDMFRHLLQSWTVAYEKAIVEQQSTLAKKVIDKASCEAVEDWSKRLESLGRLKDEDLQGRRYDTIEESIYHHIDNLRKGGMWKDGSKPTIEAIEGKENVFMITVSSCAYKEGCKWALDVPEFRENGKYRCQRLGCFVGAVKKYMSETNLSEEQREKLDYLMTTVMDETEGCKGLIFINENFMRKLLLNEYPTHLPN